MICTPSGRSPCFQNLLLLPEIPMHVFLICLAVLAFLAVAFEELIHINKAKSTLFFGTLSWIILFFWHPESEATQHTFSENILDIASLWLFLFAAMTFVAYLNQRNLISNLVYRGLPGEMPQKMLPFLIAGFAFFFSSFCDNITTSLVTFALLSALQLTREQVIKLAIVAVFSINAGGAAMITGDVTTLMILMPAKWA
jgi:Na+/H+ antiporter NhaD/arsenite permease-like protein